MEQIERYAREHGLSLWDAIERIIDDHALSTRSQSSLVTFRNLIQELSLVASSSSLPDLLRFILDRTGYRRMLEQEKTPESEARLENLDELINAAAEAAERGETHCGFSGPRRAGGRSRRLRRAAPVTLMTLHNAKGLEFPLVFLSGMELGLFPHSRSMNSEDALEEERRLCYVGMTRARKRLVLTWAKYRRRFGGGEQERSTPSWFLSEVPAHLIVDLGPQDEAGEVDLADRTGRRAPGRPAQYVHRQDLQFPREHLSVLRRARHSVQRPAETALAAEIAAAAASPPGPVRRAAHQAPAPGDAAPQGRPRRHDRGASQVWHRHRGPPRRRWRRC